MDINKTRQLAIEFERRIQTIDPTYTIEQKMDTDTILSFLNEAQRQVFNNLYTANINTTSGSERSKYINSVLGGFIQNDTLTPDEVRKSEYTVVYSLPSNFFSYIRSNSIITTTLKDGDKRRVQNVFLRGEDYLKYVNEYFDQGVILRRPVVMLDADSNNSSVNKLVLRHDEYTSVYSTDMYYYRLPKDMDILNDIPCEMPDVMFEELVQTSVLIYVTYAMSKGLGKTQNENERQQEENRVNNNEKR